MQVVSGEGSLTSSGMPTDCDMDSYYKTQARFDDPMKNAKNVD